MVVIVTNLIMDAGIYKITNLVNNKCYIGQSRTLQRRLGQHRSKLKHNKHDNQHLQNSYNKYTSENFKFEVIHYVDDISELNYWEEYYMNIYSSYLSTKGFNNQRCINNTYTISEEQKLNLSKLNRGVSNINSKNPCLYNTKHNTYTITQSRLGVKFRLGSYDSYGLALLINDICMELEAKHLIDLISVVRQSNLKHNYYGMELHKNKENVDRFLVRININKNNRLCLGMYSTPLEAAIVYNQYVIDNKLKLPLNILPFNKGVFEGNGWYCNLEV